MHSTPKPTPIYLILFAIVIVWGLSWPINKIGLAYIDPIWYAAFRLLTAAVSMLITVLIIKKLIIPKKQDWPLIIIIGLVQIGIFILLVNLGLKYVSAGRTAILVYTMPLWVMPIAAIFFKEHVHALKWIGFVLGICGIIILFSPWELNWHDHNALIGNGLLLIAALCWAISLLCARNMHWMRSPLELVTWQLFVGAIPVTIVACFTAPWHTIVWNHTLILSLLYTGIFGSAFGYWGAITISKELPSTTASLSLLAVPVASLLFSAAILHEHITVPTLIAMILILSGVLCAIVKK
jgi:drug/metabolite transporter (DMT)-like permease